MHWIHKWRAEWMQWRPGCEKWMSSNHVSSAASSNCSHRRLKVVGSVRQNSCWLIHNGVPITEPEKIKIIILAIMQPLFNHPLLVNPMLESYSNHHLAIITLAYSIYELQVEVFASDIWGGDPTAEAATTAGATPIAGATTHADASGGSAIAQWHGAISMGRR